MNKKRIISIVAFGIVATGLLWARWRPAERFEQRLAGDDTFRIVTWNVGYFAPVENKNMRDLDVEEVSQILRETKPQVVILQELGKIEQAMRIAESLGNEWVPYSVETGHGEQVVSVLTPLSVVNEEEVTCSGRNAKGITVRDNRGHLVYVLGLHSPHPARGISKTYHSITCSIEHARARSEEIRLVGGDLNYNFDRDASGDLYASIMQDFGDGTVDIGETYYAHTRIDHLFHYPRDLKVVNAESGMIDLGLRFAKVPGFRDHRPIVVSYQLGSSQ